MQTSFIWPVTNEAKLQKLIDNQNTELIKVFVGPFCIHGQHGLVKTELIEKLKFKSMVSTFLAKIKQQYAKNELNLYHLLNKM